MCYQGTLCHCPEEKVIMNIILCKTSIHIDASFVVPRKLSANASLGTTEPKALLPIDGCAIINETVCFDNLRDHFDKHINRVLWEPVPISIEIYSLNYCKSYSDVQGLSDRGFRGVTFTRRLMSI